MTRYAVLRHDLPDGSWHLDWLLDPGGPGRDPDERRLIAFRTRERPDAALEPAFQAERMRDHRLMYLDFEGELSGGGRGSVRRVSQGECQIQVLKADRLAVILHPRGQSAVSLEGAAEPASPGAERIGWSFRMVSGGAQAPAHGSGGSSILNH